MGDVDSGCYIQVRGCIHWDPINQSSATASVISVVADHQPQQCRRRPRPRPRHPRRRPQPPSSQTAPLQLQPQPTTAEETPPLSICKSHHVLYNHRGTQFELFFANRFTFLATLFLLL